ncbi:MAG: hypothetical protein IRZ00_11245 [Gemmatimonadetes bacterium]|nr:hypothetical protein [Gemmatimonadota bacterium]
MTCRSTPRRSRHGMAAAALAAGLLTVPTAGPAAPAPAFTRSATAAAAGQGAECAPAGIARGAEPDTGAAAALRRAAGAIGIARLGGRLLHIRHADVRHELHQSDRTYAPFFATISRRESWIDPAAGMRRWTDETTYIESQLPRMEWLAGDRGVYLRRDTAVAPAPGMFGLAAADRPLDVATVVAEWLAAGDARVLGRCAYRDFPRLVLARTTADGEERLYLDPKTGVPVAYVKTEPHELWGRVRAEYVYANWILAGELRYPGSSYRILDGQLERSRTISGIDAVPADSAPSLRLPAPSMDMRDALAKMLAREPDTVRVGEHAFLLRSPMYTSAVALVGDTVFVLDATLGEVRARQDSAWIARLFAGRHPVALVVTDLAWPHIAGVRFWVANGAVVYSHPASRAFLERVVARRWTERPDLLERRRDRARLVFRPVAEPTAAAGGALRLVPLDGMGSEGAIVAYVRDARFLWAGDYVQNLREPTVYASDVWEAVRRAGITPERVGAMHIPPAPWSAVEALFGAPERAAQP